MRLSVIFILLILFISCNNTPPPPNAVSGLEEPSQSELDSLKNLAAKTNAERATALKDAKVLLYANTGLIGVYVGTIDDKYFKLCLDKIYGDTAEGYIVIGTDKKPVHGKIFKLGVEPSTTGNLTIYRLILKEANKKNGEFIITLSLSPKYNTGEGNWITKSSKANKNITIKERLR